MAARADFVSKLTIISGGQTGVDRFALEAARSAGFKTGGVAPADYKTENGPDPSLKDFGLTEHAMSTYPPRTKQNILDSDSTVLITSDPTMTELTLSRAKGGSALTLKTCQKCGKQCYVNPSYEALVAFLRCPTNRVVNFAGTRGSHIDEARQEEIKAFLAAVFAEVARG